MESETRWNENIEIDLQIKSENTRMIESSDVNLARSWFETVERIVVPAKSWR